MLSLKGGKKKRGMPFFDGKFNWNTGSFRYRGQYQPILSIVSANTKKYFFSTCVVDLYINHHRENAHFISLESSKVSVDKESTPSWNSTVHVMYHSQFGSHMSWGTSNVTVVTAIFVRCQIIDHMPDIENFCHLRQLIQHYLAAVWLTSAPTLRLANPPPKDVLSSCSISMMHQENMKVLNFAWFYFCFLIVKISKISKISNLFCLFCAYLKSQLRNMMNIKSHR